MNEQVAVAPEQVTLPLPVARRATMEQPGGNDCALAGTEPSHCRQPTSKQASASALNAATDDFIEPPERQFDAAPSASDSAPMKVDNCTEPQVGL